MIYTVSEVKFVLQGITSIYKATASSRRAGRSREDKRRIECCINELLYTEEHSGEGETHECQHTLSLASISCGYFNAQRSSLVSAVQEILQGFLQQEALACNRKMDGFIEMLVLWVRFSVAYQPFHLRNHQSMPIDNHFTEFQVFYQLNITFSQDFIHKCGLAN